ncbi:MAG: hypothetical protein ACRDLK_12865 [Gaiellaceae bacterium]
MSTKDGPGTGTRACARLSVRARPDDGNCQTCPGTWHPDRSEAGIAGRCLSAERGIPVLE